MSLIKYYLAVDVGASSGRCIIGYVENRKLTTKEIHRFSNRMILDNGNKCWDINYLFKEILAGMKLAKIMGMQPTKMSIDTWGVDYVLMNKNDEIEGGVFSYRDERTKGSLGRLSTLISPNELYDRTGVQQQEFNTINQLLISSKSVDTENKKFYMIPDYFNYKLTGRTVNEFTNASTTQMLNYKTQQWDSEIIKLLNISSKLFSKVVKPGANIGVLKKQVAEEIGYNLEVIVGATHDTASAVVSVPTSEEDFIYISSGTWSLIGTEVRTVQKCSKSQEYNFTNEGGYANTYRNLKNIMGLWLVQEYTKEVGITDFEYFGSLTKYSKSTSVINVNDSSFLAPESMKEAIALFCTKTNQEVPSSDADYSSIIYRSLAIEYVKAINQLEDIHNKRYKNIYIVGGGSKARYLNELIAKESGKNVIAGPSEATAIGNILIQMIEDKEIEDVTEARELVKHSFSLVTYRE